MGCWKTFDYGGGFGEWGVGCGGGRDVLGSAGRKKFCHPEPPKPPQDSLLVHRRTPAAEDGRRTPCFVPVGRAKTPPGIRGSFERPPALRVLRRLRMTGFFSGHPPLYTRPTRNPAR